MYINAEHNELQDNPHLIIDEGSTMQPPVELYSLKTNRNQATTTTTPSPSVQEPCSEELLAGVERELTVSKNAFVTSSSLNIDRRINTTILENKSNDIIEAQESGRVARGSSEDSNIVRDDDDSHAPAAVEADDESAEEKYNRLKETCSIASSNNSSPDRKYKGKKEQQMQQQVPLMDKMRRVDFFQSNLPSNKNDMVRRGSMRDARKNLQPSANERLYKGKKKK